MQNLPYPIQFAQQFHIEGGPYTLHLIENATGKDHGIYHEQYEIIQKLAALWQERSKNNG